MAMKTFAGFGVSSLVGVALLAACPADSLLDSSMVMPSREGPRRTINHHYRCCMAERGYAAGSTN